MAKTISGADYYREKNLIHLFCIANVHNVGSREEQEDSFGISDINKTENGVLFVLADGMGGMANGKLVSMTAVSFMLEQFENYDGEAGYKEFLINSIYQLNEKVRDINEKKCANGGSTLIACVLKDNKLYFASVGDSRICKIIDGKLIKLNEEHNYENVLLKLYKQGQIPYSEVVNNKNKAALTSYIGTPNDLKIDFNENPIKMEKNQKIIIMSDGIFNTLTDTQLEEYLKNDVYNAADLIEEEILKINRKYQDNFTAIIIEPNI